MPVRMRKAWTKALRSGEYVQGSGGLCLQERDGDKPTWCCLGVGVDVLVDGEWKYDRGQWSCRGDADLPIATYREMGLPSENPVVTFYGVETALSILNDDGVPFPKIADIIDEQL